MRNIQKKHTINDSCYAIVEMRDNYIYLWIEEIRTCFFGLIKYGDRVSCVKHFSLWDIPEKENGRPCSTLTETRVYGRFMSIPNNKRNIDTFDIELEISIFYKEYIESQKRRFEFNKKLINVSTRI